MSRDSNSKLSIPFLLAMSVFYLGTNCLWISFKSFILPLQVESLISPELKGLVLGIIAGSSVAIALLVNILSGILSDHSASKWGRRAPYILIGVLLAVPGVLLTAFLPVSIMMTSISYLIIEISSNLSCGSYQPLLADIVPERQRGTEGGFQGLMTLIGTALGYGITGFLVSQGRTWVAQVLVAAVLLFATLLTLSAIRRLDTSPSHVEPLKIGSAIREIFHFRHTIPGFSWFVIANFLIMLGSFSLLFFGLYYFETVLKSPNPSEAMAITGIVILSVSAISAVILGPLSDRIGRKKMIIAASAIAGTINLVFPFITTFEILLTVASLYAITIGLFNSVNIAFVSDMVPKEESGRYMAYANLASGSANAVAPVLGGIVLFLFGGSSNPASFAALFILSSISYYIGTALMFKVPRD